MFSTTITFPRAEWRKLKETIKQLPEEASKRVNAQINEMVNDAVEEFEKYPPAVKYPIRWTSAKQRRAFFATGGFGGGIPYQRTYRIADGWRVVRQGNQYNYTLTFSNSAPYLPYVMGKWQQGFHKNTGWRKLDLVSDAVRARVRRRITRIMVLTVSEALARK